MPVETPKKPGNLANNLIQAMREGGYSLAEKLAFIELLDATRDDPLTKKFLEAMDGGVDSEEIKVRPKPPAPKP